MKSIEDTVSFNNFISGDNVLVQFSAPWCGPCKVLTSVLDGISQNDENVTIAKVDIDSLSDVASKYGIRAVPTLIYFNNGKESGRTMGAKPAAKVKEFIKTNYESK